MDSSTLRQIRSTQWPVWAACGIFIALACLFIPLTGIQADEALFGSPLFSNTGKGLLFRIRHPGIPLMLMSYLGTLKTWLYWPWLTLMPSNVWTIRLPIVLLTAATILIFYKLVESAVSRRAAVIGAFLLAVDPMFLLTATFDWGPVAIEHFLLVTGITCLFRFGAHYERIASQPEPFWHSLVRGRDRFLALGFFLLGLGLWNKAIFAWALAGLGVAAVATLWPFVGRELRFRTLAIGATAFIVGASPVIVYNLRQRAATVGENAHFGLEELAEKWQQVHATFNGNSLFGYLTADRNAVWESEVFWAMGVLLALFPLWWKSRAAWFSLVFCGVAWWLMALTNGAGASVHHTILLWPFPVLFASIVLARMPKYLGTSAVIVMVSMHLAVVSQYFLELKQRSGPGLVWTDALFPLSEALKSAEGRTVFVTDWGIYDSLYLLHKGRLHLRIASGPLTPEYPTQAEVDDIGRMLKTPGGIWVSHMPGQEIVPSVDQHLEALVEASGKHRKILKTIRGTHGRPVFEIFEIE